MGQALMGLKERMAELRAGGMSQEEALITAAEEGLIPDETAEAMLRVTQPVDAMLAEPAPKRSDSSGATPEEIMRWASEGNLGPQEAQILRRPLPPLDEAEMARQMAADPEMAQAPAQAMTFPPSAPASLPPSRSFPPSGPPTRAPVAQPARGIDPALLALIVRAMGRRR